jgi:hypothetical protein
VKHNVTGGWVLASTKSGTGVAELTVTNGGEHIPSDQVTGLFEPFRRLSGRTGNRPGSGLGLSIVASVANAHGGHAEAHARPDGGLDVQITLPAAATAQPVPRRTPGHALKPPGGTAPPPPPPPRPGALPPAPRPGHPAGPGVLGSRPAGRQPL